MNTPLLTTASELDVVVASDQASLAFFSTIPWMSSVVLDPSLVSRPLSWHTNHDLSSEPLFRRTFNTANTIPHFCILVPRTEGFSAVRVERLTALLEFGPDLAGHPGICHGGILSTVLDEIMGTLVILYCENCEKDIFTANLTVNFLKPVHAPGVVMVKARVEKRDGRKIFASADVIEGTNGGDDGSEILLTQGRGLFIVAKDKTKDGAQ